MNAELENPAFLDGTIKWLEEALANDNTQRPISHLRNGTGSRTGCLSSLANNAEKRALLAWLKGHDIVAMRQWFRESSRLRRLRLEAETNTSGPLGASLALLYPLVSNDCELINWFAHFEGTYDPDRVLDRRTLDFLAYQTVIAMRGDWGLLESRCDAVIADPPRTAGLQKYMVDHHVYRALARGDELGLRVAMQTLLDPQLVRSRSNDEGGYTEGLIFTPAIILAKLAWRRGMNIEIDSPLVPAEWLPLDSAPPMVSAFGV